MPFSKRLSKNTVQEVDRGIYAKSDWYVAHAAVVKDQDEYVFATDQ